jgi:hypothetical protein
MNIELKRFTTSTRLSQETTAFAADVWVDGAKAGHAENDGHGGATIVHLDPAVRAKVEAHGKALVPDEYKSLTGGAEWIVDQLVEATLQRKAEAALSKKISKNDTNARVVLAKEGLRAARFRVGATWCWFAFKPLDDPKAIATALVAKQAGGLDELVVLS